LASGFTGTPIIPPFQPEPSEQPVADSTVPATNKTKNKASQPLICEIISFRTADRNRLQKDIVKKDWVETSIMGKYNTQFIVKNIATLGSTSRR
jgi:hypothetical protein